MIKRIKLQTQNRDEFVDVTAQVRNAVEESAVSDGICTVFVPHTTSAITIQENADPDVARDIIVSLLRLCPDRDKGDYQHIEQNAPAHVKASLIGNSVSVPVEAGKLLLGVWQAIFFCEFDGPRKREIIVHAK